MVDGAVNPAGAYQRQFASDRAQLPVHLHKIKVVPGFDELAVFDSDDGDAVEFGLSPGSLESQAVAHMLTSN